jgi:hypothetical protein
MRNAKLIVHADAVLACPVALQGFKPVAGRNAEIIEPTCDLQLPHLAPRHALNLLKPLDPASASQCFGISILERDDHPENNNAPLLASSVMVATNASACIG